MKMSWETEERSYILAARHPQFCLKGKTVSLAKELVLAADREGASLKHLHEFKH